MHTDTIWCVKTSFLKTKLFQQRSASPNNEFSDHLQKFCEFKLPVAISVKLLYRVRYSLVVRLLINRLQHSLELTCLERVRLVGVARNEGFGYAFDLLWSETECV